MTPDNYVICSECRGKGSVEREVRVSTMNSGGFAFIEIDCPKCHGEREVKVDLYLEMNNEQL